MVGTEQLEHQSKFKIIFEIDKKRGELVAIKDFDTKKFLVLLLLLFLFLFLFFVLGLKIQFVVAIVSSIFFSC
jgi:hypothetical protein